MEAGEHEEEAPSPVSNNSENNNVDLFNQTMQGIVFDVNNDRLSNIEEIIAANQAQSTADIAALTSKLDNLANIVSSLVAVVSNNNSNNNEVREVQRSKERSKSFEKRLAETVDKQIESDDEQTDGQKSNSKNPRRQSLLDQALSAVKSEEETKVSSVASVLPPFSKTLSNPRSQHDVSAFFFAIKQYQISNKIGVKAGAYLTQDCVNILRQAIVNGVPGYAGTHTDISEEEIMMLSNRELEEIICMINEPTDLYDFI